MLPTCQQVLDYLSDYVEGRLPAGEKARLEEHLAVCPECVRYLDSFAATLRACQKVRTAEFASLPPVPEELVQAVLGALIRR